jgi:hypothetical protein
MNTNEIRKWANNLKSNDAPESMWNNPSELFKFIIKNWDFSGSYEDACAIYAVMYPASADLTCTRCGHSWYPRNPSVKPKYCPKCNSPYWDKPRGVI